MMSRAILTLLFATALVACDKPADQAANTPEVTAEPTTEQPEQPEVAAVEAATPKPSSGLAEDLKSGEQGFYGAQFTVIEEPITLANAFEHAGDQPIKVEATVQTVCKKKGCWFTMGGEGVDQDVRVRMKDYAFFVPRNSEKAHVVAEGTLKERELSQEEAQHYADDAVEAGETPEKVDAPQKVWEFTATAIELRASEG